jgi:arylsulfatase
MMIKKNRISLVLTAISGVMLTSCATTPPQNVATKKPNILYIVADDLGYSDIGAFGGEISTPNLDGLVKTGRLLTNYHTSTVCAVTRSMLYSGTDHHLVGEGTMGVPNDERKGLPGYEGYLNNHALSIAELLKDGGYHTYIAGKWHLGSKLNSSEDKTPDQWGFERSFTLLNGATPNHFSHDTSDKKTYTENGQFVSIPALDSKGLPWFDTNVYTQKLIENIDSNIKDGKPFAAFATYTAPHWPLQVPEPWLSQYKGKYDVGYEVIRKQRLARQKQLGLVPDDYTTASESLPNISTVLPATKNDNKPNASYINAESFFNANRHNVDYGEGRENLTWENLTPEQQRVQARYMEIYAGMVSNLDHNIGLLIAHLKDIGEYNNTFIVFHSDNGAEGATVTPEQERINAQYIDQLGKDQSLRVQGTPETNVRYGQRWAAVSATPFRLYKTFTTEGGTSVPAIAHLPGQTEQYPALRDFSHVTDTAPTLLELAGIPQPTTRSQTKGVNGVDMISYKDRTVYPITGRSFLAELKGDTTNKLHTLPVGEEQYGRAYLRSGEWKLVWTDPPFGPLDGHWQLYNIEKDRAETQDVSAGHPDVVSELYAKWQTYMHDTGGVLAKRPRNARY